MKVKVCGLNNKSNITDVIASGADFIGLIFYDKSPRSVSKGDVDAEFCKRLEAAKVGVFVNERAEVVLEIANEYGLNYLQLHGDESPEYCYQMKQSVYKVWKAFSVGDSLDKEKLKAYENSIDTYLFDTKGKNHGGNGIKFNWQVLEQYELSKPFILSGGISLADADDVLKFTHSKLDAIDVNSGFEKKPGLKKVNEIKEFINTIK